MLFEDTIEAFLEFIGEKDIMCSEFRDAAREAPVEGDTAAGSGTTGEGFSGGGGW